MGDFTRYPFPNPEHRIAEVFRHEGLEVPVVPATWASLAPGIRHSHGFTQYLDRR